MALLLASTANHAYPLLLIATAFVGVGFGLTVPALNSFTAAFHPGGVGAAVLVLNAILGAGTVAAPLPPVARVPRSLPDSGCTPASQSYMESAKP